MIYFDKLKVKSKTVYKITHVDGDFIAITKYFDMHKDAEQFADWYAKKRDCEVHKSFKVKKKK